MENLVRRILNLEVDVDGNAFVQPPGFSHHDFLKLLEPVNRVSARDDETIAPHIPNQQMEVEVEGFQKNFA